MLNAYLEFCMDGYNVTNEKIESLSLLEKRLYEIKEKASGIYKCTFSVDIVIEDVGRMTIGLDQESILCFNSIDGEYFTSLGDQSANGEIMFYMGDYSSLSRKYVISYVDALDGLITWIKIN